MNDKSDTTYQLKSTITDAIKNVKELNQSFITNVLMFMIFLLLVVLILYFFYMYNLDSRECKIFNKLYSSLDNLEINFFINISSAQRLLISKDNVINIRDFIIISHHNQVCARHQNKSPYPFHQS